jgi:hypothetical protein
VQAQGDVVDAPHAVERVLVRVGGRREVGAGAEVTAGAGDHQHAVVLGRLDLAEQGLQRCEGGRVQRVLLLRAVDGCGDHAVGARDVQRPADSLILVLPVRHAPCAAVVEAAP